MRTIHIARWVIVLLLLAALPGLTGVMAQEERSPAKQMQPEATELGESLVTIPWSNTEREPNDSWEGASYFNDFWGGVAGGLLSPEDDVDYWAISWERWEAEWDSSRAPVLINIDAHSFGSPADTVICLYADDGIRLACNDDMQGSTVRDSLLYYNLEQDRTYYLSVRDYYGNGGSAYRYQLLVSRPLLISAAAVNLGTGHVDGIPFKAGDILAWNAYEAMGVKYEKWVMLLDLSDVPVSGNITNVAAGWRNSDTLLVGFPAPVVIPGITGKVNPWEVVTFDVQQVGPNTVGTYARWWNGKSQGLSTVAEKIDAIDWPDWNGTTRLKVSTVGTASVPGASGTALKLFDEDIGLWSLSNGKWSLAFDGDGQAADFSHNWKLASKDVIAYTYGHEEDMCCANQSYAPTMPLDYYWDFIVLQGTGTITYVGEGNFTETVAFSQKDILGFRLDDQVYFPRALSMWHGPDHGWNYKIDAIDFLMPFGP